MYYMSTPISSFAVASNDNSAVPLIVLLIPVVFALFNIIMAYFGSKRFKKLRRIGDQHEWLLQQKNNSLALIDDRIARPLQEIKAVVEKLYTDKKIPLEARKKLVEPIDVTHARVTNLSRELQRTSLSVTLESVDTIPFYRSATTLLVGVTTAVVLVVLDAILVSTETLQLTFSVILMQVFAYLLAVSAVLFTNRYKHISDTLLAHSKATLRLQQSVDDAKDHIISLVVKVVVQDVESIKSNLALYLDKATQAEIKPLVESVTHVVERLELLNNIESRLIKSDVVLLNVEDLIEEVLRKYQPRLDAKGIQVEHFHRVGAAKIQQSIVQDRALLRMALNEVFENAVLYAPEHTVIKILSEHNLTNTSITVADQGLTKQFVHTKDRPFSQESGDEPGLGVGLYIADQVMHILGGELKITHNKPAGNTVQMSFINNYVR